MLGVYTMASRLELHDELCEILGSEKVYFQPPASVKMSYPCIRYSRSRSDQKRANNHIYLNTPGYEGIVIDNNPDSVIPDKILEHFPMCSLGNPYVADNLNHFPFTLYY
jgi:hypothetical protein